MRPHLRALAARAGIEDGYVDVSGVHHTTSDATREALLAAMGFDAGTEALAEQALADWPEGGADPGPLAARCPDAPARAIGLHVNLYAVTSARNQGIGDLTDVVRLGRWAATWGADFLAVNPLNVLGYRYPDISPYSPSSRCWGNPLYLDVDAVEGVERADHAGLRAGQWVDYDAVADHKEALLRAVAPTSIPDDPELVRFATHQALQAHHRGAWPTWPAEHQDPDHPAVAAFAAAHTREVAYHAWLQLELDRQRAHTARALADAGLAIGMMGDLPLGSARDGYDTWAFRDAFAHGAHLGAPPDPLGPMGQDWELPPLAPHRLRATGYALWRRIVRTALRHVGALRIDHVLGMVRQFWIPAGRPASEGAYVRQDTDTLLGILADEAVRAGAIIVGEDLGTVPPELPGILDRTGILSTRVAMFERHGDDIPPSHWLGRRTLATATTHDLPPIEAWWTDADLDLAAELGTRPKESLDAERAGRHGHRDAWRRRFAWDGLPADPPIAGIHAWLLRSEAALVGLTLDDLTGETRPVNIPGTRQDTWPSWRRRSTRTVEELDDPEVTARVGPVPRA